MKKVRFTIDELKGNVRLLFTVGFITTLVVVVCQVLLIKFEKESFQTQTKWNNNAHFLSDYKSAFYKIHDDSFVMTKEYAITISHAIQSFEDIEIKEGPFSEELAGWKEMLEEILNIRSRDKDFGHDHKKCVALAAKIDVVSNEALLNYNRAIQRQQDRIDALNIIILLLPVFLLALLTYAAFFSYYGAGE